MYIQRTIVIGHTLAFINHCMFDFGSCVKDHEEPTLSKNMTERMRGEI